MGGSYGVMGTVYLVRTGNPSSTNLPQIQIGPTMIHPVGVSQEHQFTCALAINGPDRIILNTRPIAATNDTTLGSFEYLQC